jgi:hypothetical protein
MTYLIFKHTKQPQELISAISLSLLIKEDNFDWENVIVSYIPNKLSKFNFFQLIGNLLACEEYKIKNKEFTTGYTILKSKKIIKSDKFLLATLKSSYIGCLKPKTTKKEILEKLIGYDEISNVRRLKRMFEQPTLPQIKYYLPKLKMTDKEIMELIDIDAKQERKVLSAIDKKFADTFSKILNESVLVKNF